VGMSEAKKCKIVKAARSVFLRYGYRRVSMNEIAAAAGVSRPALYLLFKNKEEIFIGVFFDWVEDAIAAIETAMAKASTPTAKIEQAFEIWAVQPFEMMLGSPEVRELVECSFDFAQNAMRQGYVQFEAVLTPVLASAGVRRSDVVRPADVAHVLASAVRGFKQAATTPDELRQLIRALLTLCLAR
jgi:TetR/AcrR family transcriptional regulator of autoinduction and epiphytic fitness